MKYHTPDISIKYSKKKFSEWRIFARRLISFVLSIMACALPLWLTYVLILFGPEVIGNGFAAPLFSAALLVAGLGVLFSLLASVGVRSWTQQHLHWGLRWGALVFWAIGVSVVWWNAVQSFLALAGLTDSLPTYSPLLQAWISIPLGAALFYVTYVIRTYTVRKLASRREIALDIRRKKAFTLYPKALALHDHLDVSEILESLDALKKTYEKSRRRGKRLLELLQYQLSVSSDPRYNLPMPLPVAIEFLGRELTLLNEIERWAATIRISSDQSFPQEMLVEPALLCAAGAFAAAYGNCHSARDLVLNIVFQESPLPSVEIRTNIEAEGFLLHRDSAAEKARNRLVQVLNQFASKGATLQCTDTPDGHLVFRVSVRRAARTGGDAWEDVEQKLGHGVQLLVDCERSEGSNRVYGSGDSIYKVQLLDRHSQKPLMLSEEHNILQRLVGIEGVPHSVKYEEHTDFAVLSYNKIEGTPIDKYLGRFNFERPVWFRCIAELSALLNRIHKRGVLHRDLRPDNILVAEDGRISLIDFDQAVSGLHGGQQVDLQGNQFGVVPPCISMPQLIDSLGLRDEYQEVADALRNAWRIAAGSDARSPGQELAYYRWTFGDVELSGEHEWFDRWDMIYRALRTHLPQGHILDLGCNLGLSAAFFMLYGAEYVTAVDAHSDVLVAGEKLATAAGVKVSFLRGNLDSRDFVDSLLAREYSVVIALSVLQWLDDRGEALRLLASPPILLFEGHDPTSVQMGMLRELGFRHTQLIGYSERLRGLYLASR